MRHIVLFKFKKKSSFDEIGKLVETTYEKLKNDYNLIKGYEYKLNCIDKEANMDLVLFVDLENESSLSPYIEHEVHQLFLKALAEYNIIAKAVIDVE